MNPVSHPPASAAARRLFARSGLAAGVFAAAAVSSLHAQNVTKNWDNDAADNDWFNPLNWSGDTLPATGIANNGDNLNINLGGTAQAIYATGTSTYRSLRVGTGNTTGVLAITGGTLATDNSLQTRIGAGATGHGTVHQSGGAVTFGGWTQVGLDVGSVGAYDLSGGTVVFNRESGNTATATVPANTSLILGDGGTGTLTVSGGSLQTRAGVALGRLTGVGTGTFHVVGSGATAIGIGSFNTLDGRWTQNAGSTLKFSFDAGGATKIFIDEIDGNAATGGNGDVIFAAGALLDVGYVSSTVSGTWTVMEWDGTLTDHGLAFAAGVDTDVWSFAFVGNALQITAAAAIPEPATWAALAGVAVLGLAAGRRRRRSSRR